MSRLLTKAFLTLLLLAPVLAHADISKLVFTTDAHSVKPGELSPAITIQAQDSSGNPYQTTETLDLVFTSTSQTGEFLGSTGNPVTKTMNKNTSNRTFYYRDSSLGNFTLTVKAVGRESGESWSASQSITVSTSATSIESEEADSYTSSVRTPAFSSPSSLKVGAGADRLATVGTPVEFEADSNQAAKFEWNFGDGRTDTGEKTDHVYEYPGEYIVVLNARTDSAKASARVKVRVIEPALKISYVSADRIEILNDSTEEINLFGRALASGGKVFIFPRDTILARGSRVSFSSHLTGLEPSNVNETEIIVVGDMPNIWQVESELQLKHEEKMQKEVFEKEILRLENALSSLAKPAVATVTSKAEVSVVVLPDEEEVEVLGTSTPVTEESEAELKTSWLEILKKFFLWRKEAN